jgi:hypothetical protein
LGLVDDSVLQSEQADEQIAVRGHVGLRRDINV